MGFCLRPFSTAFLILVYSSPIICTSSTPQTARSKLGHSLETLATSMALTTSAVPTLCYARGILGDSSREEFYNKYNSQPNERIFDTKVGSFFPARSFFYNGKLKEEEIVIYGEVHTNNMMHNAEFEILKNMNQMHGSKNIAVGMESFYRQHQASLDRFSFVHGSFDRLKKETNYDAVWGFDFNYYSKLLAYCATHNIKIIGLNVPNQITQMIATTGYNELDDRLKEILPIIDFNDKAHKEQFVKTMSTHMNIIENKDKLERYYQSECLWDEYMADSLAIYKSQHPSHKVLAIVGSGHVRYRRGIPNRVAKRTQINPYVIIGEQVEFDASSGLPEINRLPAHDEADLIWYTA